MGLTTTGNRATTRYVARLSLVASLAATLLVLPGLMSAHPGQADCPHNSSRTTAHAPSHCSWHCAGSESGEGAPSTTDSFLFLVVRTLTFQQKIEPLTLNFSCSSPRAPPSLAL